MVHTNKDKIRVVIATSVYRIEGDMHVLADSRLTDALNSKAKDFFAVTNAQVYSLEGSERLFEPEYVAVSRSAIAVVFPL